MTETTKTPRAKKAAKADKGPSNISKGREIFAAELARRANGEFADNRAFRSRVMGRMQMELDVSVASSATMYNVASKEATAANPAVGLGRDPKKVKVAKVKVAKVAETV